MLDREGHVKVMDFGIAHSVVLAHTAPGDVLGTPSYMAPEQAARGGQIDARTDIYLFGLLLYEMYTGTAAGGDLQKAGIEELITQHHEVIPKSSVPVITRCLQQAPSARYQSANEVALALRVEHILSAGKQVRPQSTMVSNLPAKIGRYEVIEVIGRGGMGVQLRLFDVATRVEEELIRINSNLEGPCTRTEMWRRLPKFLLDRQLITASTARSLELFRSMGCKTASWKGWSDSQLITTVDQGEALINTLKAIPAPEFTVNEINIVLFQDENCTIPLQERLGVRVNIQYSVGSNALRMYPAGRKFRVGEQVNPWWETRRPYTRIYYLDSLGKPALAWDFAFPFVGVIAGTATVEYE